MSEKRYVYEGMEVKLTGRKAKNCGVLSGHKIVEVTPVIGPDYTKHWTSESDLYEIYEDDFNIEITTEGDYNKNGK